MTISPVSAATGVPAPSGTSRPPVGGFTALLGQHLEQHPGDADRRAVEPGDHGGVRREHGRSEARERRGVDRPDHRAAARHEPEDAVRHADGGHDRQAMLEAASHPSAAPSDGTAALVARLVAHAASGVTGDGSTSPGKGGEADAQGGADTGEPAVAPVAALGAPAASGAAAVGLVGAAAAGGVAGVGSVGTAGPASGATASADGGSAAVPSTAGSGAAPAGATQGTGPLAGAVPNPAAITAEARTAGGAAEGTGGEKAARKAAGKADGTAGGTAGGDVAGTRGVPGTPGSPAVAGPGGAAGSPGARHDRDPAGQDAGTPAGQVAAQDSAQDGTTSTGANTLQHGLTHTASGPAASTAASGAAAATGGGATGVPGNAVTDQVFGQVTRLVARGDGTHRLMLRLHPADLGEVRVVLTVKNGTVDVTLAAGGRAREALHEGSPQLRSLLQLTGATAGHVVIRDLAGGPAGLTSSTSAGHQQAASDGADQNGRQHLPDEQASAGAGSFTGHGGEAGGHLADGHPGDAHGLAAGDPDLTPRPRHGPAGARDATAAPSAARIGTPATTRLDLNL